MRSANEALRVLYAGTEHRTVGETQMNGRSSRSHAILTIKVSRATVRTALSREMGSRTSPNMPNSVRTMRR